MRVLLAFDKFKDSLAAHQACEVAARALHGRDPEWELDLCPLADGGEGFTEILTMAAGGRLVPCRVAGPRGDPVEAKLGLVPLKKIPRAAQAFFPTGNPDALIALADLASASGLALLPPEQRDPWQTTSQGTGQLLQAAAGLGATAIVLGVGGSATHDLGLGALSALGLCFCGTDGKDIGPPTPGRWPEIITINREVSPLFPPLFIACDVTNPLLGPNGAATVYAPQKGLQAEDLPRLEAESARLARLLCTHNGRPESLMNEPGAGAAGGIAFGLMCAARAKLRPGFDLVAAWLDLDARLAAADMVITGEGRFDASSLSGKGPGAVVRRALALGKPVHVFAGGIATATHPGLALHAITPAGTPLAQALREAPANLTVAMQSAF
ncbi:MAG TPA: glycerate kinase [Opitutaceae bacterium]|jgi:glycerate kinase|nr:glycerate kinase [Opitutaceae bacterium]